MNTTINIPTWLASKTDLNWNEKALYAVYHYFTLFGEIKCCKLTNAELGKRLGLEERTVQRCKKHLKELCYISTDGGITTTALVRGDKNCTLGVTKMVLGGDKNGTHNREENKEYNKEYNICTYNNGGCNTSNISTLYGECEETINNEQLFCVDGESDIQRKYTNIKKDIDNGCFCSLEQLEFRIALDRIPATESRQIKQHYYQWDRENIYDSEEEDNTPMVQENIDLDYKSLYSNL